jgi:hypothetical protein
MPISVPGMPITGSKKRPWKSQERFRLSHNFKPSNNNKLDHRDHFQQNAKTSVASLRGLIGSSRNIDRHHSRMLIGLIGIPADFEFLLCHLSGPESGVVSNPFPIYG